MTWTEWLHGWYPTYQDMRMLMGILLIIIVSLASDMEKK